ncbi:phage tail sheath C-terminal domain-containing protein [Pseudomonas sp. HR96]|uniref:phage tail sheath family protein n=1 Tax=Pseudomonas sp. HR96 TaxID=1027966 RepID=UPI002A75A4D0|nr:phage tail sheath C-terminal domain-containing protein [Pseudomonas sp. HR96]WPO98647.1 phage tail sheath C-terminal domain-containing protein [Pseudomonas sp. HR96]
MTTMTKPTPGVYVWEAPGTFLTVASGASAVPAFLYAHPTGSLLDGPAENEQSKPDKKGKAKSRKGVAEAAQPAAGTDGAQVLDNDAIVHRIPNWVTFTREFGPADGSEFVLDRGNVLHLAVKTYLDNGGGLFYTVSTGEGWAEEIESREDITLVVQAGTGPAALAGEIAALCEKPFQTRFGLLDGPVGPLPLPTGFPEGPNIAAFYPWLEASWAGENKIPPSAAVAGAICETDGLHGPWHAAANFDLRGGVTPLIHISDSDQADYMEPALNMIRAFPGRPSVIWGVRTRDNTPENKYIPVRRLMLNAQKDIRKALRPLIFEPNHQPTWQRARGAITSYLRRIWEQGGLMGGTENEAFFVQVGLDETMVQADLLEGKMIIHVGLAITRPAEFIVLRFTQIMNMPAA